MVLLCIFALYMPREWGSFTDLSPILMGGRDMRGVELPFSSIERDNKLVLLSCSREGEQLEQA
jgi:hypothetical protein